MPRIVLIGAGSHFGWTLSADILAREPLRDGSLALCDTHAGRLAETSAFVAAMIEKHGLPTRLETSTDRRELLRDADVVVVSISVGGQAYSGEPYYSEVELPRRYGIEQTVADTIGVGGIFRFLRCAPVMVDIARDMEQLCPGAPMLNYTNPMAMLIWAISEATGIANVGLCHSVQHTHRELCGYLGVPREETSFAVAGINHQAWFTSLRRGSEDLYPALRAALDDPAIFAKDSVRFELMRHFGYFVTESSRHNSEYYPYFRQDAETMARLGLEPRAEVAREARQGHFERMRQRYYADDGSLLDQPLAASHEFASGIIAATVTGEPFCFHGNVINHGLIDNLPAGCCVEVPCTTDRNGVHPHHVGALPPACAALNRTNLNPQELAVRAYLERDRELAFRACALDPLTAAVLPLHRIRELFEELWAAEGALLDHFAG